MFTGSAQYLAGSAGTCRAAAARAPLTVLLAALLAAACATSPLGRTQVQLYSEADMRRMGEAAFAEMRRELPATRSEALQAYVLCVARPITAVSPSPQERWEIVVFDDEQVNAFALPGGKIGVYEGMLAVAENQHQLAAVIAHEVGHVIAGHANERLSASTLTDVGLQVASIIAGGPSVQRDRAFAALGLGLQVGVLLPFSRTQEEEADLVGLDLMAEAGFDPRAAVALWQNMARRPDGRPPPEFLSTHPSSERRIEALRARMPQAIARYEQARAAGRVPACAPPANVARQAAGRDPAP